jgi:hypothetical protein
MMILRRKSSKLYLATTRKRKKSECFLDTVQQTGPNPDLTLAQLLSLISPGRSRADS